MNRRKLGSLFASLFVLAGTALISQPTQVQADLPVHCLTKDVKGTWELSLGPQNDTPGPSTCSSDMPNTNLKNLELMASGATDFSQTASKKYSVELSAEQEVDSDNKAGGWKKLSVKDKHGKTIGHWTMVYDEGFEVRITDPTFFEDGRPRTFFAFSGYAELCSEHGKPNDPSCKAGGECQSFSKRNGDGEQADGSLRCYVSKCGTTTLGWHHTAETDVDKRTWGCFSAKQTAGEGKSSFVVIKTVAKKRSGGPVDAASFVEQQNKRKDGSWAARNYEFRATGSRLHRRQYDKFGLHTPQIEGYSFLQRGQATVSSRGSISIDSNSQLFACPSPTAQTDNQVMLTGPTKNGFSWLEELGFNPPAIDQGSCGSCYAVASAYVFQTRIQIALKKQYGILPQDYQVLLSPQHVLSCSFYNQGCNGGYPFLVGKWANDYGIPEEACMNYLAKDKQACPGKFSQGSALFQTGADFSNAQANADKCNDVWYAKDYGYVGGHYEHSSEARMMKEIYENGPVVVAIDAPDALSYYKSGVLDSPPQSHAKFCDMGHADMNGWEYTDHALVVVGWGEVPEAERCQEAGCCYKYWIVRNSWGDNWGQQGYVKICRGKNLGGIENQAVFITPDLTKGRAAEIVAKYKKTPAFFQSSVALHNGPVAV
eukprot:GDKI01035878.1.p1 GENE.GDKI01035878.1~~GDKI01035878.1.p1  ORF type:complete len:654 (-),score=173.20 GDKI01035878.1:434-2395(-)